MVFICVFCVFMLHLRGIFILEKTPKTSGVIVVCSGLERIGNSLKIRKMAGYVKHWKVEDFLRFASLVHDK